MESIIHFFSESKSIIIVIHAVSAAIGLGAATVSDVLFFKFMTDGKIDRTETPVLDSMTRIMWIALSLLIISGIGLFLSDPQGYLQSSKFLVKMFIVFAIALNGFVMTIYLHPRMQSLNFTNPGSTRVKKIAFALGGISIGSWYLSFLLGSVRSIPLSTELGILLYIVTLVVAIAASQVLYKRYAKKFSQNKTRR
jgi:hypothetical protein